MIRALFNKLKRLSLNLKKRRLPNTHLDASFSRKESIPGSDLSIFLRPTYSDYSRLCELLENIYTSNTYFDSKIAEISSLNLIDLGANIGGATLALLRKFKNIKSVIGVEAESFNYQMLHRNYFLFNEYFPQVSFKPVYGAITSDKNNVIEQSRNIRTESESLSISGTFTFKSSKVLTEGDSGTIPSITINEVLKSFDSNPLIVKIDIEGGEEDLFVSDYSWLKRVSFLTIELHDEYGLNFSNSSRNFLKALSSYDFAVVPRDSVLHCFNRQILNSTSKM